MENKRDDKYRIEKGRKITGQQQNKGDTKTGTEETYI
jgi:hypothetical protein